MKDEKWKKIKTERVFDHKHFTVNKDTVELPDGRVVDWFYWDRRDSTMVVPLTTDRKVVMIRQYRYLPDQMALEFPSGASQEGETLEKCAKRELKEETGYSCEKLVKLGGFYETMAQLNRRIHIYLAKDVKTSAEDQRLFKSTEPDEYEETEVILLDLGEVAKMVMQNKIVSMGSSLAVLLAKEHIEGE